MLNNDKKRKLRGLLAKLDPQEEAKLLAKNLEEDIKAVESKIVEAKDYSPLFKEIQDAFNNLKSNLSEQLQNVVDKPSLEEFKKVSHETIDLLEKKLTLKLDNLQTDILGADSEIKGIKDDSENQIADLLICMMDF